MIVNEKYLGYFAIALIISMFIGIIYMIISIVKTETKVKIFRKNIKIGDVVHCQIHQGADGEITEISDDYVKVSVKVFKSRVYQK